MTNLAQRRRPSAPQFRSGFSLIEAAIVLGVVGLVIGGIWVAAAAVQQKMALNRTVELVNRSVEEIRKSFTPSGCDAIPNVASDLGTTLAARGLFKGFTTVPEASSVYGGYTVDLPFRTIDIGNPTRVNPGLYFGCDSSRIYLGLTVPPEICSQLVAQFSASKFLYRGDPPFASWQDWATSACDPASMGSDMGQIDLNLPF